MMPGRTANITVGVGPLLILNLSTVISLFIETPAPSNGQKSTNILDTN